MIAEIYTSSFCGYCLLAKNIFKNKNITFLEIILDSHPDKRTEMKRRSNGKTSVPQIFISGLYVGGHKELAILERNGGLDSGSFNKNSNSNG